MNDTTSYRNVPLNPLVRIVELEAALAAAQAANAHWHHRVEQLKIDNEAYAEKLASADAALVVAQNDLLKALYGALFDMGKRGANWNIDHPLRPAWEMARRAITSFTEAMEMVGK